MRKKIVKKGEVIQKAGDLGHEVYHVESGLLRSYAIDDHGKESIFAFAAEGWTIADHSIPDEPARLYIDAIEDSTIYISPKDLKLEAQQVSKIVKRMNVLQTRIIMLLSTSAIERYEHFIATYPDIVQRVPQRMIASYLGVNPETLSAAKRQRMLQQRA